MSASQQRKKMGVLLLILLCTLVFFPPSSFKTALEAKRHPQIPVNAIQGAPIDGSADLLPGGGAAAGSTAGASEGQHPVGMPGSAPFVGKPMPAGISMEELAAPAPEPEALPGHQPLTFGYLSSFPYEVNDDGTVAELPDGTKSRVPESFLQLDGSQVSLSGFMVPLALDGSEVTDFVLVKNQLLCCYGQAPRMNEWVFVTMQKPVTVNVDKPIAVSGTLSVGEDKVASQVLSIYRLQGHTVQEM